MHEKSPLLVPELFAQCSFSIVAEVCYITIEGKVILVSEEFSVSFISSDEKRLTAVVLFVKYARYVQLQLPPKGDKTVGRSHPLPPVELSFTSDIMLSGPLSDERNNEM